MSGFLWLIYLLFSNKPANTKSTEYKVVYQDDILDFDII